MGSPFNVYPMFAHRSIDFYTNELSPIACTNIDLPSHLYLLFIITQLSMTITILHAIKAHVLSPISRCNR